MNMKQSIIDKLFDGKELTQEELVFVSKALRNTDQEDVKDYIHDTDNSLTAIGASEEEYNSYSKDMEKLFNDPEIRIKNSLLCQELEKYASKSDTHFRLLLLNFIKLAIANQKEEDNLPPEIKEIKDMIQEKLGGKGKVGVKIVKGPEGLGDLLGGGGGAGKGLEEMMNLMKFIKMMKELRDMDDKKDKDSEK